MTTATVTPSVLDGSTKVDWAETGTKILPERHRDAFLRCLNGEPITEDDEDNRPVKWVPPVGDLPFSPGMSIKTILRALGIRSPLAFSHSQAWEYDDRNGTPRPGSMGAYVATATVLGIRTAKQELWFLDAGTDVTPVLFVTRPTVAHWHFTPGTDGIVSTSAFATPERAEFAANLVNRSRDDDKKVEPIRCACTEGEKFRARSDALAFLDQNGLAARTLNADQVAPYAAHHAGGLYVLIGAAADSETPVDGATSTCGRCRRPIAWERDDAGSPYGFWYDDDHGTEVCIPGPNDEDRYHRPATDTGKFVKLHDSWGDEGKVIVHEYDPDNPTDDEPMWEFDTGADALKKFIERISES